MAAVSEDTRAAAERLGAPALALEVVGVDRRSSGLLRLHVAEPSLAWVPYRAGQDLTVLIPGADRPLRRRYSIRALDRPASTAELDVVLHGDGPGVRWAAGAVEGDRLEAIGPRGKIWPDAQAAWHLFVGDESYLGAAFAMAESLPADRRAVVVIERSADVDEQPLSTAAALTGPLWVRRSAADAADPGRSLVEALADLDLPGGPGHAYLGGEHHAVAAVRSALVGRGLDEASISAKAYWRADLPNADHGEPVRD